MELTFSKDSSRKLMQENKTFNRNIYLAKINLKSRGIMYFFINLNDIIDSNLNFMSRNILKKLKFS